MFEVGKKGRRAVGKGRMRRWGESGDEEMGRERWHMGASI
jgi:hypothetical protein